MKHNNFYYEVNQIIFDTHRHLKIIDKQIRMTNRKDGKNYHTKMYKMQCIKCGWTDFWMDESEIKRGRGCSCCSGKTIVAGINSIADTHPWTIDYFIGGYDEAIKYTKGTYKRATLRCPICKITVKSYLLSNLINNHGIACCCNNKISYPERCVMYILEQLDISYIHQLNKKHFLWCDKYRYDFYIPKYNCIIETHGIQHYKECESFTRCGLSDIQENDSIKYDIAFKNGINEYIVLDCRESSIDYIKNSIFKSKLSEFLNLSNINWYDIEQSINYSIYKKIVDLWNNSDLTVTSIFNITGIDRERITYLLEVANKNKDVIYTKTENNRRRLLSSKKSGINRQKPILCKDKVLYFRSVAEVNNQSNDIFGFTVNVEALQDSIRKKRTYKGLLFEYISKEQFNKMKQESPELCFGDSFVL